MPRRARHPCRWPGCPNLTSDRYCDEHQRQSQMQYDAQRGTAAQRGYDAAWRRLRRMVLARHPLCADVYGVHAEHGETVLATDVDHIVPRSAGGTDTFENLQSLCQSCHSRKTAEQDGAWGRGGAISRA